MKLPLRPQRVSTVPPPTRPRGETAMAARDLVYCVGAARLIDDVSIELRYGEVLAVVGPNGAGKSTLLRLLAGDLHPTSGEVLLEGRPLHTYSARELALRRAVLPQQTTLQFAFTALEVVLMGRSPYGRGGYTDSPHDLAVAREAMRRTDMLDLADRPFQALSGGEQQRVTLARVLAQQVRILLLDEPTNALDIRHQELVMQIAREEAAAGAAVLAVLHDLNLAAAHADRIAVLHHGRLVACGAPFAVMTADLLSTVFEHPLVVTEHPLIAAPLILPERADEPIL
jgi:iron complex transport system ATP-binding protein